MAFPTIQAADTKNGTVAANAQTWTLTYPTNLASGDLIFAFVARDGAASLIQFGTAGFTGSTQAASGANRLGFAAKFSNGTETGTFSLDVGASEQGGWRIFRITGVEQSTISSGLTAGPVSCQSGGGQATSTGASLNPDPPSCDPLDWGTEETLWFAPCSLDTSRTISVYPLADNNSSDVSGGSTGATLGLCTTNSAVSSLDPGTYTISSSDDWAAATVAVRPVSTTRVPRSPGVDSGNAHLCKAWQAARRWRHGAHGIRVPDTVFAH